VFAVVARGLGSDWAEGHARAMLLAEGMTEQGYESSRQPCVALQELPAAGVAGISEPVVTYAVEGVPPG
jgi:hypothetical protein